MTTADAEPCPATERPRSSIRTTLAAFRVRNYRLYVTSQVMTNSCGWMQRISQDWLMLTLTGDVAMVGLTVALQFLPILAFGLLGGVIADRYDKRRILMITQSVMGLVALTLGVLTLTGVVQPWHVLAMAATLGFTTVADNPARQSFVPELVGLKHLRSAISVNASIFQLGALVGPMLAAVSIEMVGEGLSFVINAAACAAAVVLLVMMRPAELKTPAVVRRARGQLREGLASVRSQPRILWPTVLVGFVAVSGINLATVLTAYADDVFESGAGGYGMLSAMVAVGAIIGSLVTSQRHARLRQLVWGAAVIGALEVGAATLGHQALFAMALVAIGMANLMYLTSSNALVQSTTTPNMRGRIMALYIVVLLGAQAFSGVLIGRIASEFGPQVAMAACGVGPLIGAAVIGIALARRGRLSARLILRERPGRGFVYIVPREPQRPATTLLASGGPSRHGREGHAVTGDPRQRARVRHAASEVRPRGRLARGSQARSSATRASRLLRGRRSTSSRTVPGRSRRSRSMRAARRPTDPS